METIEQKKCKHNLLDRTIDENENQICSTCGEVMITAEELYYDDDDYISFEFEDDDDLYYDYKIDFIE